MSADNKIVHIRIPAKLWNEIKDKAKQRGGTASSEIRRLLYEKYLGQNKSGRI